VHTTPLERRRGIDTRCAQPPTTPPPTAAAAADDDPPCAVTPPPATALREEERRAALMAPATALEAEATHAILHLALEKKKTKNLIRFAAAANRRARPSEGCEA